MEQSYQKLAEGAQGEVGFVFDEDTKKPYAIKKFKSKSDFDQECSAYQLVNQIQAEKKGKGWIPFL